MALPKRDNLTSISEATRARYLKNLNEQLQVLRQAMERSDFAVVREICHRVRGSASLFGMSDLGEACRNMEEAAMARNAEQIVSGFQVIEVIVTRATVDAQF